MSQAETYDEKGNVKWKVFDPDIATLYAKYNCRHCHGRGKVVYDLGHNNELGIPPNITFINYCPCVKRRYAKLGEIANGREK